MVTTANDFSGLFGPARNQHDRPTCLAFAMSDAHAHAKNFLPELLSPEYVFYHAALRMPTNAYWGGASFNAMADALTAEGQPPEIDCPYDIDLMSDDPLPSPILPVGSTVRFASSKSVVESFAYLVDRLTNSQPLVLVLRITAGFQRAQSDNPIIHYIDGALERGLHAVVAVGIGFDKNGFPCFKVRNSWGMGWGSEGYAWLHRSYIDHHLDSIVMVQ